MLNRKLLAISFPVAGVLVVAGGCFVLPGFLGPMNPYDGRWRVIETPAGGFWCIDIQNDEVVAHEGGCDPPASTIIKSFPGTSNGTDKQWMVDVLPPLPGSDVVRYIYGVEEQPDGSLKGTVGLHMLDPNGVMGPGTSALIVMTRE